MLKVLYPVTEVPVEGKGRKANTKKIDLAQKILRISLALASVVRIFP